MMKEIATGYWVPENAELAEVVLIIQSHGKESCWGFVGGPLQQWFSSPNLQNRCPDDVRCGNLVLGLSGRSILLPLCRWLPVLHTQCGGSPLAHVAENARDVDVTQKPIGEENLVLDSPLHSDETIAYGDTIMYMMSMCKNLFICYC